MNLTHLEQFIVIAEKKNMTRAAECLYISQPNLSRNIKELEEDLGVELFLRTKNGLELTDEGHKILDRAKMVIAEIAKMKCAEVVEKQVKPSISFGSISTPCFKTILVDFMNKNPTYNITSHLLYQSEMKNALLRGEIDIMFSPEKIIEKDKIKNLFLCYETVGILVPKSNPLSEKDVIAFSELEGQDFIWFEHPKGELQELMLKKRNTHINIIYKTNIPLPENLYSTSDALIFTTSMMNESLSNRKIVYFSDTEETLPIYISYLDKNNKKLRIFIDWVIENYGNQHNNHDPL